MAKRVLRRILACSLTAVPAVSQGKGKGHNKHDGDDDGRGKGKKKAKQDFDSAGPEVITSYYSGAIRICRLGWRNEE